MPTRRRRRRVLLEEIRRVARDDLAHVATQLAELEAVASERDGYYEAVGLHQRAEERLPSIRSVEDARAVAHLAAQARRAISAARHDVAIELDAAPCFFDPRHGPSVRDVLFAPEGGALRPVPACEACGEALEAGQLPQLRRVLLDGRPQPYWRSPAHVGYAGRGPTTTIDDLLGGNDVSLSVVGTLGLGVVDLIVGSLIDW
jgi:hypothetical protein